MASRSLGTLTLDLIAKIGGFVAALDKAARATKKSSDDMAANTKKASTSFSKSTSDIVKTAKTAAKAVGVAVTGYAVAFTAATLKMVNDLSKLHDTAQIVGIGVETFQAWSYAAEQAGISTGEFETAMRRAATNVGKAATGNKAAVKIFEDLKVSTLDLSKNVRTTENILRDYTEAVSKLSTAQERTAASAAIFGRGIGPKMVLFMQGGNASLLEMEQRARALGIVLNEETVEAAENFGDELDTLKRIFTTGLAANMGAFVPLLSELARNVIEAAPALAELTDQFISLFNVTKGGVLRGQIEDIGEEIDNLAFALNELREQSFLDKVLQEGPLTALLFGEDLEKQAEAEAKRIEEMLEAKRVILERLREKYRDLFNPPDVAAEATGDSRGGNVKPTADVEKEKRDAERAIRDAERAAQKRAQAMEDIESAAQAATDASEEARRKQEDFFIQLERQAQQVAEELATEEELITASYERRRQIILNSVELTEQQKAELLQRNVTRLGDDLVANEEQLSEERLALNGSFWEKYLAAAEENLLTLDELSAELLSDISGQFGAAFESMIFDATSLEDAVKGMAESILRSVVNAIGQMAAQWLILQAIQLALGKSSEAAAIAGATATGAAMSAAYGPPAALASLMSFGANAAPAIAGMAATMAAAQAMSLIGMAHEGIDTVPKTGTWLLEKGERVTTAETSARLDSMLSRMANGGSTSVVVNNAPQGTMANTRRGPDGSNVVEVMVADLQSDGPLSRAIAGTYALQRRGR